MLNQFVRRHISEQLVLHQHCCFPIWRRHGTTRDVGEMNLHIRLDPNKLHQIGLESQMHGNTMHIAANSLGHPLTAKKHQKIIGSQHPSKLRTVEDRVQTKLFGPAFFSAGALTGVA